MNEESTFNLMIEDGYYKPNCVSPTTGRKKIR